MTDENKVDLTLVLDESPSMNSIRDETIAGVNTLLTDQKKLLEAGKKVTLNLVKFNERVFEGFAQELAVVESLNRATYRPGGMGTALWDAIGKTIELTGKRLKSLPEERRPGRVIFVIYTDGQENSSKDFTDTRVKEMIDKQRDKFNWDFIFLGAEMNAYLVGSALGIKINLNVARTAASTASAWGSTSNVLHMKAMAPSVMDSMNVGYSASDYNMQAAAGAFAQDDDPAVKALKQKIGHTSITTL